MSPSKKTYSCPSAPAQKGAKAFAAIGGDGRAHNFKTLMDVPDEFFEEEDPRDLEKRFRFTFACQETGCAQWKNGGCSVAGRVLQETESLGLQTQEMPPCAIRGDCRWYEQAGAVACGKCSYVVTGVYEHEVEVPTE